MAYFFSLPPLDDLTINQQAALNEPIKNIKITGAPGTGKSVVALWRFLQKLGTNKKMLLLTYTKSLEAYFKGAADNIDKNARNYIDRTLWWTTHKASGYFDEIIVDEAQDVEFNKYEKIKNYTKGISYGFDPKQSLYFNPAQVQQLEEDLTKLLPNNVHHILTKNYRNTYEIMRFVQSFLPNYPIPKPMLDDLFTRNRGEKPQLIIYDDEIYEIIKIINTFYSENHNIGILMPFCTTNSLTSEYQFNEYLASIKKKINYRISSYCRNLDGDKDVKIENIHLTTFKSAKGLEFDTVIIPKFHNFKLLIDRAKVVELNDFYVALTRARNNLFLLSEKNLDFLHKDTVKVVDNTLLF